MPAQKPFQAAGQGAIPGLGGPQAFDRMRSGIGGGHGSGQQPSQTPGRQPSALPP